MLKSRLSKLAATLALPLLLSIAPPSAHAEVKVDRKFLGRQARARHHRGPAPFHAALDGNARAPADHRLHHGRAEEDQVRHHQDPALGRARGRPHHGDDQHHRPLQSLKSAPRDRRHAFRQHHQGLSRSRTSGRADAGRQQFRLRRRGAAGDRARDVGDAGCAAGRDRHDLLRRRGRPDLDGRRRSELPSRSARRISSSVSPSSIRTPSRKRCSTSTWSATATCI